MPLAVIVALKISYRGVSFTIFNLSEEIKVLKNLILSNI